MVSLLLQYGADRELCNGARQRPIDVADDDDIVELLSRDNNRHLPVPDQDHTHGDHSDVAVKTNSQTSIHEPLDLSIPRGHSFIHSSFISFYFIRGVTKRKPINGVQN